MKLFSPLIVVLLLIASWPARAEEPEDHYLRIMKLIEQAEAFNTNSQAGLALAKFQQARAELKTFQTAYPTWNVKVVTYRSKYLAERVTALSAPPVPPAESDTRPDTKGTAGNATTLVKLVEPGAEPRKVLRLHPKPGDKQTLSLTMKMAVEMSMGETQIPPMKLPAMTMIMDLTVKTVTAEGDITYDTVMSDASIAEDPDVLPQVAEAMKSSMGGVKGLSGSGAMSNRGLSKGTDFKAPTGADPQLSQTMEQMRQAFAQCALALPEEAVGPGAKWEVKKPITSQGMTIHQTANYQLVSIEGERVIAKATIVQSAANQKIQNPAMPALKVDLKKMEGKGTGEITLDLARAMPAKGNTESHSELSMEMNTGGQKQPMAMKADLNVLLEAK
jgi:hypothetical protein